ncbi:MAG: hypothetical protein RLZZ241_2555 [Bacteroidota bacterium]|jgi:thiopurine S-methyltransferase
MNLNKDFWEARYACGETGWDIGYAAPALIAYIDQLPDKSIKILIPGAGRGHEVAYLWKCGFKNLVVVDIAQQPLAALRIKIPDLPEASLVHADFFEWGDNPFDLILEQTFFCALAPELRTSYVLKMYELLKTGGKVAGLLFDFPLTASGPPFGGCESEYLDLFKHRFFVHKLERAINSIPPRAGKELFFIFEKI